jgi:hypothetical protein
MDKHDLQNASIQSNFLKTENELNLQSAGHSFKSRTHTVPTAQTKQIQNLFSRNLNQTKPNLFYFPPKLIHFIFCVQFELTNSNHSFDPKQDSTHGYTHA